jgi:hypothetical protein
MNAARKLTESKPIKRAHVTIPDDVEGLFAWYVKYDPRFEGSPAAAAAYFFAQGLRAEYARGLREADPIDEKTYKALVKGQARALRDVMTD